MIQVVARRNVLADQLFDNILQCYNTKSTTVFARVLRYQRHMGVPFLEVVQDVETACLRARFWESREDKLGHGFGVFWVISDERFHQ